VRPGKLLRPRLPGDAGVRPRLTAALDRGRDCPLVLLSGPAGCGKTTRLGQWLAAPARPAVWLTPGAREDVRELSSKPVRAWPSAPWAAQRGARGAAQRRPAGDQPQVVGRRGRPATCRQVTKLLASIAR